MLDMTPFPFSLELAALSARSDALSLEKWLQERVSSHRLPFAQVGHRLPYFGCFGLSGA